MELPSAQSDRKLINNEYYDHLGARWHQKDDDPIALLRAESKIKIAWTLQRLPQPMKGLDIGCGAGFVTWALDGAGHQMTGLDFSEPSLEVARSGAEHHMSLTETVKKVPLFIQGDAYKLPFPDSSFDFVTCFDFLEHVSDPVAVVREASRVLKPGGRFFYHTFNRNRLSWLIVIKGLEWFVKNTPPDLHVYPLFIKPKELEAACTSSALTVSEVVGIRPCLTKDLLTLLLTGRVPGTFQFTLTGSLLISYLGMATKAR